MKLKANGKLNLVLDIGAREDNGYHQMKMIMQTVSIADFIDCDFKLDEPLEITSSVEIEGENIVAKAVRKYAEASNLAIGGKIHIDKNIPMTAGMGGGSADCAAVLLALDRTFKKVDKQSLDAIALSLGADVPFAMVGGTAYATGVGENLTPLSPLPQCYIVLASGGIKDSTGAMFGRFDQAEEQFHPAIEDAINCVNKGELESLCKLMGNSFAPLWQNDRVQFVCKAFEDAGALGHSLSGAGPTLFGVFDSLEKAKMAAETIHNHLGWSCICQPTAKSIEEIE